MIPKGFLTGTIVACGFVFGDVASRHRPRRVTPVCGLARGVARRRTSSASREATIAWESHLSARTGFSSSLIGSEVPAEMERVEVVRCPRRPTSRTLPAYLRAQ